MSGELIGAILGSLATLVAALGVFMVRSGFHRVITGGTEREATAVGQMADLLSTLSTAQIERERELLDTVKVSLATVAEITQTATSIASGLEHHSDTTAGYYQEVQKKEDAIIALLGALKAKVDEIAQLQLEISIEILKATRKIKADTGPLGRRRASKTEKAENENDETQD